MTYGGGSAYGTAPAQLNIPENLYSQFNAVVPGGKTATTGAGSFINSELNGEVAPDVQNLIQNKGAAYGIASGQPMTGGPGSFSTNNYLASLGLTSQGLKEQGTHDYLAFLGGITPNLSDPRLSYEVKLQNAIDAAAPNPEAAARTMTSLSQPVNYGGGGGRGGPAAPTGVNPAGVPFYDENAPSNVIYGPGGGPGVLPNDGIVSGSYGDLHGGYGGYSGYSGPQNNGASYAYTGSAEGAPSYGDATEEDAGGVFDSMFSDYLNGI